VCRGFEPYPEHAETLTKSGASLLSALQSPMPATNRNRAKCQSGGTPGPPSWWHAADLLDSYADDLRDALRVLVRTVSFTTAISNADCHAKNVSFLLEGGQLSLAPLYDTVPTALWPSLRANATMALAINDVAMVAAISVDDIFAEARRWRIPTDVARRSAIELLEELQSVIGSCDHPGVAELVTQNTERMLAGSR